MSYKKLIYDSFINKKYQECFSMYGTSIYFDYYKLDYDKIIKIADIIEHDKFITRLSFHNCNIDDTSAIYLFNKLKNNNTVKVLIFHGNKITEYGFAALSELMKTNAIISLCLSSINIGSSIKCINEIIKNNKTIIELNLGKMNMKRRDFKSLVLALEYNQSIITLYLYDNKKLCNSKFSYKYLLKLFKNKNIKTLSLHSCNISSELIDLIFNAMISNTTLTELVLSYNEITSNNIIKLCELIKNNNTLERLELGYNKFNDHDGLMILGSLHYNSSLNDLNLKQTGYFNKFMPDIDLNLRISDDTIDKIYTELGKKH